VLSSKARESPKYSPAEILQTSARVRGRREEDLMAPERMIYMLEPSHLVEDISPFGNVPRMNFFASASTSSASIVSNTGVLSQQLRGQIIYWSSTSILIHITISYDPYVC